MCNKCGPLIVSVQDALLGVRPCSHRSGPRRNRNRANDSEKKRECARSVCVCACACACACACMGAFDVRACVGDVGFARVTPHAI